jgi:peptidoglycan/LPS O-acetylase OafA/YrhL
LRLYKLVRKIVPYFFQSKPGSKPPAHRSTLVAAGLLLIALSLVVSFTSRKAFFSPLALVVVAAIGLAALLLQIRLRPDLASSANVHGPMWLNGIGVLSALAALVADFFHARQAWVLIAALVAVVSFGASGIVVINSLRKRRA